MVIDKFGRSSSYNYQNSSQIKSRIFGFNLTPSGDFDFQKKRICNLPTPTHPNDAANKSYVDEKIKQINTLRTEMRLKVHNLSNTLNTVRSEINALNSKLNRENLEKSNIPSSSSKPNDGKVN